MRQSRGEGETTPVVSGFTDHGSKQLTWKALSRGHTTHRVGVGVFCRLPLAPGVATLILIYFIRELRMTCIGLGQQAMGKARVTKGEQVADKPNSFQWCRTIYSLGGTSSLLILALWVLPSELLFVLTAFDIRLIKGPAGTMRPNLQRTPQTTSNQGGDQGKGLGGSILQGPQISYVCFSLGLFRFFSAKLLAISSKEQAVLLPHSPYFKKWSGNSLVGPSMKILTHGLLGLGFLDSSQVGSQTRPFKTPTSSWAPGKPILTPCHANFPLGCETMLTIHRGKYRGSNFDLNLLPGVHSSEVSFSLTGATSFPCCILPQNQALERSQKTQRPNHLYKLGSSITSLGPREGEQKTRQLPVRSHSALTGFDLLLFQSQCPLPFPVLTNLSPSCPIQISFPFSLLATPTPAKVSRHGLKAIMGKHQVLTEQTQHTHFPPSLMPM